MDADIPSPPSGAARIAALFMAHACRGKFRLPAALILAVPILAAACADEAGTAGDAGEGSRLRVMATVDVFADIVRNVAGERAEVSSLLPGGSDPHTYDPSPSDIRRLKDADVVFSNGLFLESQGITRIIEPNMAEGAVHVKLAESAADLGAQLIKFQEPVSPARSLLFLGLRVSVDEGIFDGDEVRLSLREFSGPGHFFLYATDTFGVPDVDMNTRDGISDSDGLTLRVGSHTHLNWAFTAPGAYAITLEAEGAGAGRLQTIAQAPYTFEVTDETPNRPDALSTGHVDLALTGAPGMFRFVIQDHENKSELDPSARVLLVPGEARTQVPEDERFRFLGEAGSDVWILPQGILGRHEHGEFDPHLWLSVENAKLYAKAVRDTLSRVDPEGAAEYAANYEGYVQVLEELEQYVEQRLSGIPAEARKLVTTHDAFGYLAGAFGFQVTGFVSPVPGQDPSPRDLARLEQDIAEAGVPAVFVEPQLSSEGNILHQIAGQMGVRVCTLYGESLDGRVTSYVELMRFNAGELARCLGS